MAHEGQAEATPFRRTVENHAAHLGGHLGQRLKPLAVMHDAPDVHLLDPCPCSGGINHEANVHSVVILKAQLPQHVASGRHDAPEGLVQVGNLRKIEPEERACGQGRHAARRTAEPRLHKVGFPRAKGPDQGAQQASSQPLQVRIQVHDVLRRSGREPVLHGGALPQQRAR